MAAALLRRPRWASNETRKILGLRADLVRVAKCVLHDLLTLAAGHLRLHGFSIACRGGSPFDPRRDTG